MGTVRIGLSGWSYDSWQGDFYPDDLPKTRRLEYVAERFPAVEVNGSFYSLLSADTWRKYRDETPADFRFAVKGSRFITHDKQLSDVRVPLANFLASGLLELGRKLDVILWQFQARRAVRPGRLAAFLEMVPRNTEALSTLAAEHDGRVREPVVEAPGPNHRIRHAVELRSDDDLTPERIDILRDAGAALVVSHAGDWRCVEELTAGFVYSRLHGAPRTYASRYEDDALEGWAERLRAWRDGNEPDDPARITDRKAPPRKSRDAYVFFDNDAEGHAPHDALRLKELL
jgi:uncharacterized protein YecE (DUF72 family)